MPRHQPTEIVVVDYSNKRTNKLIALPTVPETAEIASPVMRKRRRRKRANGIELKKRRADNRKLWHRLHVVELNATKKLLFKALRLLRRNGVELPREMAAVLSQHESGRPNKVGGHRVVHELEVSTA